MTKEIRIFFRAIFMCSALCPLSFLAAAQGVPVKSAAPAHQRAVPSWITMMDDPNVNYHDAVKAFDAYWKNRTKPLEEDEQFETGGKKEKEEKLHKERESRLSKNDPAIKYVYEYKRFLHWKMEMEPFVQPDGHIKDMDTRIREWKQQRQQQQSQEREQRVRQQQQSKAKKSGEDTSHDRKPENPQPQVRKTKGSPADPKQLI